jgi:hypothetical protein
MALSLVGCLQPAFTPKRQARLSANLESLTHPRDVVVMPAAARYVVEKPAGNLIEARQVPLHVSRCLNSQQVGMYLRRQVRHFIVGVGW